MQNEREILRSYQQGTAYHLSVSDERLCIILNDPSIEDRLLEMISRFPDDKDNLIQYEKISADHYVLNFPSDARSKLCDLVEDSDLPIFWTNVYQSASGIIVPSRDEIAVRFVDDFSKMQIEQFIRHYKLVYLRRYYDIGKAYSFKITPSTMKYVASKCGEKGKHDGSTVVSLIYEEYSKSIKYADYNRLERHSSFGSGSDFLIDEQWHLQTKCSGPYVHENAGISANSAWEISAGSRDVVVAVLDDGFDLAHPNLMGDGKVVAPLDFVEGDDSPYPIMSKDSSRNDRHGTACSALAIGERRTKTGVSGVAPGCAFMPVRIPFNANIDQLWNIFDRTSKVANVISCSWGPLPQPSPLAGVLWDKLRLIAQHGGPDGRGTTIVFAAGNYNCPLLASDGQGYTFKNHKGLDQTPSSIENGFAIHPHVMSVSACNSKVKKSNYSNWGEQISVCAPSNDKIQMKPREYVEARSIWTADTEKQSTGYTKGSRYTGRFGGTSASAPMVAGVAALVKSVNPDLTSPEIRQVIETTADAVTDRSPDPDPLRQGVARGVPDANGRSDWFGFGKVNALKAVKFAHKLNTQNKIA